MLSSEGQLDAAEETVSRAINLLPEEGNQFLLYRCQRNLGAIHQFKGETEKAVHHFETALGIASAFDWHDELFGNRLALAILSLIHGKLDDAHTHIEQAKPFMVNSYQLAELIYLQARVFCEQRRLEESKSEALRAADIFEKLGAVQDLEGCNQLLQDIRKELGDPANRVKWWAPGETATSCAYLHVSLRSGNRATVLVVASISSDMSPRNFELHLSTLILLQHHCYTLP